MDSIFHYTRQCYLCAVAFFIFGILFMTTEANILVYSLQNNQLIDEYNDLPSTFGPSLPPNGLKVYPNVLPSERDFGCDWIPPPQKSNYPSNSKFVIIIQRGGENCTFEAKVRRAQASRYNAVIVYNNGNEDLEQMSARNSVDIHIPSVYVGHTTGLSLTAAVKDVVLIINDELPFNINKQLILPFSILIGLCFLIMVFYMIYKCIREERRLRRYRLPKSMLKKIPVTKFTKNSGLSHDTCVICLEEFMEGDKLRILPCRHPYHSHCIDPWLTENRRVCPICKRKVFTKGEVQSNRNRQSSLDSLTDTDDDTTPLLRQALNHSENEATSAAAQHGTFTGSRGATNDANTADDGNATDDGNVLLADAVVQPRERTRRDNPFDRRPQAATENGVHRLRFPFMRFFQRRQPISIAAPPLLEEVLPDNRRAAATAIAAADTSVQPINVGTTFRDDYDDDDESPPQSIYEPVPSIVTTAINTTTSLLVGDSLFMQPPTQGGIGVVALPSDRRQRNASRDHQFLV